MQCTGNAQVQNVSDKRVSASVHLVSEERIKKTDINSLTGGRIYVVERISEGKADFEEFFHLILTGRGPEEGRLGRRLNVIENFSRSVERARISMLRCRRRKT